MTSPSRVAVAAEGGHAGHGLDAAGVGPDGGLRDDGDGADGAEGGHMGAAAQLDRMGPGPNHPHLLAVLLLEEGEGTGRLGLGLGHLLDVDVGIGEHVLVGHGQDGIELLVGHRARGG